jgi:hypothetical protein
MTNRKRGRPVGTHIRDEKPLAMVADKIAANPELKPSTAMRQVYAASNWPGTEKTVVTRWLRKWRAVGPAALEAAQRGQNALTRPLSQATPAHWPYALEISDEMRTALIELAQIQEPMRQGLAEMAKTLAPTRELLQQMAPSIKEFQAQVADAVGSLKIFEINEALKNTPALRISEAIKSAVKVRIH